MTWLLGLTVYRRGCLFVCDLAAVEPHSTELPLRFGYIDESDIPAYMALRPARSVDAVMRRLDVGDIAFGGWLDDRLVTVGWARPGRAGFSDFGVTLELEPDEVYVYGSFTAPELRGHNVATARSSRLLIGLRDMGYRRTVAYVVPEDRAALGPVSKLGYRHAGWIGFAGIRPLRVVFVKEHGERLQIRWRHGGTVRLHSGGRTGAAAAGIIGGAGIFLAPWAALLDLLLPR
jgi:hypothetical protein